MRLFLSSENLGNYPKVFLEMVGGQHKLATIHNAIDDWTPSDRLTKVNKHLEQLISIGFKPEDIDLRDYFNKPKELEKKISEFGGVFVYGGNSFIVRRAFAYSGFDKILSRLCHKDKIAYGGSSAGSMVMTPDLEGPDWSDEDGADIVPTGYNPKPIYEGLGLVDFYVVPHFGSKLHGDSPQKLADYYKSKNLEHYTLKDGQAIIINGAKEEFLE